jgi:hypothetical protein
LFQKRIYSIFFGTKAAKRKLSILKERWFDIANYAPHQNKRHFFLIAETSFLRF